MYFNNVDPDLVTHIYIEKKNYDDIDITAWLQTIAAGDQVYTYDVDDITKFAIYNITAVAEDTTYFDFTVTAIDSNGAYSAADKITFDINYQGPTGPTGPTGLTGATGATGPAGATGTGLISGGLEGQILAKNTDTNYDLVWIDNYAKELRVIVKNMSGGTIAKGKAVMATGATGDTIEVNLADATGATPSRYMLGITSQAIASEATGYVTLIGGLQHLNTNAYTVGTILWLDPAVAGGLTPTEPNAPALRMSVAVVTRKNASSGRIYVRMYSQQPALHELLDVAITGPQSNEILKYNDSTNTWQNSNSLTVNSISSNKYQAGSGIVVTESTTSRSLSTADDGIVLMCTSNSAVTITVPTGLGVGFTITVIQAGTGQITFNTSGTTINNRQSHSKTAGQWAVVSLIQRTTNNFVLAGDTST
jgi:hypothetical protein